MYNPYGQNPHGKHTRSCTHVHEHTHAYSIRISLLPEAPVCSFHVIWTSLGNFHLFFHVIECHRWCSASLGKHCPVAVLGHFYLGKSPAKSTIHFSGSSLRRNHASGAPSNVFKFRQTSSKGLGCGSSVCHLHTSAGVSEFHFAENLQIEGLLKRNFLKLPMAAEDPLSYFKYYLLYCTPGGTWQILASLNFTKCLELLTETLKMPLIIFMNIKHVSTNAERLFEKQIS